MTTKTYECVICLNINSAVRLQCCTCGTIPVQYSPIRVPSAYRPDAMRAFIPVVIARGADRTEHHHNTKTYLRTVKLDYYATA